MTAGARCNPEMTVCCGTLWHDSGTTEINSGAVPGGQDRRLRRPLGTLWRPTQESRSGEANNADPIGADFAGEDPREPVRPASQRERAAVIVQLLATA